MQSGSGPTPRASFLATHFLGLTLTWIAVLAVLLTLDLLHTRRSYQRMALNQARADFNKDQAFRFWAASHGGVYVPVTENTPENPHLSHLSERDIRTPSGKSLTLMNPAYMLRSLLEQYADLYDVRGHITSLMYFRPETAPDEWERDALVRLAHGEEEVAEILELNGEPRLRFMRPIHTQEDCLKCHAGNGHKPGDVQGGISVSISMEPYMAQARDEMLLHSVFLSILLLFGLAGIGFARRTLMREMAERDRAEYGLRETRDALEERMRELSDMNGLLKQNNIALEEFASIASHDMMEPLRKIICFGNLLDESSRGVLNGAGLDYLQRMQKAAGRMKTLLEALLEYSRIDNKTGSFERIDLAGLIKEVIDDLEARLEATGGAVELRDLPSLEADPNLMRQLFQNLIANALKYHREEERPEVKIWCTRPREGFVEILVEDNGIGFDPRDCERIFKPFERLHGKGRFEGTGMGLAICKRIVEKHGGSITARSQPGAGTTFIVALPESR